jgi:hypothetical protein
MNGRCRSSGLRREIVEVNKEDFDGCDGVYSFIVTCHIETLYFCKYSFYENLKSFLYLKEAKSLINIFRYVT